MILINKKENVMSKKFDFNKWKGVIDQDNHADDYYADDEAYIYCDDCGNLMVPDGGGYKCPVCGSTEGSI